MPEGPLLAVWALLTAVLVGLVLVRSEQRAVDDPVQKAARGEVRGLGPLSLVREDRLGAALAALARRYPGGRIVRLRVAPTRVDAGVRTSGYTVHAVQVDAGLGVDELGTSEAVERGLARVPAGAPERLLRRVNARTGTSPDDVDYVTLTELGGGPGWYLKLARGGAPDRRDFVARLDGSGVRRNGEPAP